MSVSLRFLMLQQYEEWKKGLPDTDWIKELVPEVDIDKFRSALIKASENIKGKANELDIGMLQLFSLFWFFVSWLLLPDPKIQATLGNLAGFRQWFEKRLDDAIQAAEVEKTNGKEEAVDENSTVVIPEPKPPDITPGIFINIASLNNSTPAEFGMYCSSC